jgi:hypothetical protein
LTWIKSNTSLQNHPKLRRVARSLSISSAQAFGHLHFLWFLGVEYADDGSLTRFAIQEVADAAEWPGDPNEFVDALIKAGFLDVEGDHVVFHDWMDHAGALIEARREDAERKRVARKASKAGPGDIHGMSNVEKSREEGEETREDQNRKEERNKNGSLPSNDGNDSVSDQGKKLAEQFTVRVSKITNKTVKPSSKDAQHFESLLASVDFTGISKTIEFWPGEDSFWIGPAHTSRKFVEHFDKIDAQRAGHEYRKKGSTGKPHPEWEANPTELIEGSDFLQRMSNQDSPNDPS